MLTINRTELLDGTKILSVKIRLNCSQPHGLPHSTFDGQPGLLEVHFVVQRVEFLNVRHQSSVSHPKKLEEAV